MHTWYHKKNSLTSYKLLCTTNSGQAPTYVVIRYFWATVKSKLGETINEQSRTDKAHREMEEFTYQIDFTEYLIYKPSTRRHPPPQQAVAHEASQSSIALNRPWIW